MVRGSGDIDVLVVGGERDDEGLEALAEELALKGPVQRMKAALDALAGKG